MKQQGKEWISPEGKTLAKYVPAYIKKCEHLGSRIAAAMTSIEEYLEKNKLLVNELCQNMFKHYQAEHPGEDVKRFSFTTFDKEFKIEVDVDKNYIRCYRATKQNPKATDYELVNTDFARAGLRVPLVGGAVVPGTEIEPSKSFGSLESATKDIEPPKELFAAEEDLTGV